MLFAGTYERFLFGFKLPAVAKADEPHQLVKSCTYAAHQNAVKCVAAGGYFIASGGADDQIHLYDIKHGKDMGFLMNPGDGAVPCIQFYCPPGAGGAPSHMFSGSADGSIAVWRAGGGWEHLKLMKGHKGSVNSLTVHSSGRLALSVAHDCTLRMWDLAKGRSHYSTSLDLEADLVSFTPSGDSYLLVAGPKVTLHSAAGEGKLMAKMEHSRRVSSLTQLSENVLVAGLEDGSLKVWDVRAPALQHSQDRAHTTRVRGLVGITSGAGACPHHLASAASDGVIKLWDMRCLTSAPSSSASRPTSSQPPLACLAEVATRARITCLTIADPTAPGPKPPPQPAVKAPPAAEAAATAPGKAVAVGKQAAGKAAAGLQQQQQQGKRGPGGAAVAPPAAVGKGQKEAPKVAKHKREVQYPGFEVVSEHQQAFQQQKKQRHNEEDSDDEDERPLQGGHQGRPSGKAQQPKPSGQPASGAGKQKQQGSGKGKGHKRTQA